MEKLTDIAKQITPLPTMIIDTQDTQATQNQQANDVENNETITQQSSNQTSSPVLPTIANPGDAGIDLRSAIDYELKPGCRKMIPTGIRIALPVGSVGLVCPRSGLAAKHGISIVNAPGIVDSGYRGEICVILYNSDPNQPFKITRGDRIAQLVVMPYISCSVEVVGELDETVRGAGGFGSSGVA